MTQSRGFKALTTVVRQQRLNKTATSWEEAGQGKTLTPLTTCFFSWIRDKASGPVARLASLHTVRVLFGGRLGSSTRVTNPTRAQEGST